MEPQLYMFKEIRRHLLKRHDFYVAQVRARVIYQFDNIEEEAERYAEREYSELGSLPGDEDSDMSVIADIAQGRAQEFYDLLSDLKKNTTLSSLAGMYHQWEKDLRDFIDKELRHNYGKESIEKLVWQSKIEDIFNVLKMFGWECQTKDFFRNIDACRLIVNVYKHGQGKSLNDLKENYPDFLNDPLQIDEEKFRYSGDILSYKWLAVSKSQFDDIAGAIRNFWIEFPERLFLKKV